MASRKLPPFPALRAFEAAGRLGSFKAAAEVLCVTPSAISHQVRVLEAFVGKDLFVRTIRHVELTQHGRGYLAQLTPVLDRLDTATRALTDKPSTTALRLRMTEGFSKRWLMPRLHLFLADHPDLEISIETGLPPTDFRSGALDIVIHWGADPVKGVVVEPFMSSTRVPVCSPAFLAANPDLKFPRDLLRKTLIRDEVADGWAEWFRHAGVTDAATHAQAPGKAPGIAGNGPVLAHCELTMSAAENGLGVALGYKAMIGHTLQRGDLVMPIAYESPARTIYSIAYEDRRAEAPMIMAFRDWLFETVQPENAGLDGAHILHAAQ